MRVLLRARLCAVLAAAGGTTTMASLMAAAIMAIFVSATAGLLFYLYVCPARAAIVVRFCVVAMSSVYFTQTVRAARCHDHSRRIVAH